MKISNSEFDAAVGDMKATLDHLRVPTEEQKELLAIIETTREQIAEKR
jgi:hemoglobin